MTRQQDFDDYMVYCEMMNPPRVITQAELSLNLEIARIQRKENTIPHYGGKYAENESRLDDIALSKCKSKTEYLLEQAEADIKRRPVGIGAMEHKQVDEMALHYRDKATRAQNSELRAQAEVIKCESTIEKLKQIAGQITGTRAQRRIENQLEHWQARLSDKQDILLKHQRKTAKFDDAAMKWRGIEAKIELGKIIKEIALEKRGNSTANKYGFNPLAQDRETAEIMFQD